MKAETAVFLANQVIFREGDPPDGLYFVKEGKIEIYRERDGTEVSLGFSGPGDVLGTMTLFNREPRTACARAVAQTTLVHIRPEALESVMREIPTWVGAVVKDAIGRLKIVDEKLVESKLQEKRLLQRVGTPFHHGSQLASFLGSLVRYGTIKEDDIELFPLKGFMARAEGVLLRRAEYLESLFQCFVQAALVKQVDDKKHGRALLKPRAQVVEDFAVFCLQSGRNNLAGFAPTKLYPWMSGLVRVNRKLPEQENFLKADLALHLGKEMGRQVSDALIDEFVAHNVVRYVSGRERVSFTAAQLQKRIVFENACRLIRDCAEPDS